MKGFLTAKLADSTVRILISSDRADGVLMSRFKLGISLRLALKIHLTEHVESSVLSNVPSASSRFALNWSSEVPSTLIALEAIRLAVLRVVKLVYINSGKRQKRKGKVNLHDRRQ